MTTRAPFPRRTLLTNTTRSVCAPVHSVRELPFAKRSDTAMPSYFDGKLFIYDWIRHSIMAVTIQPNGDYEAMQRFAPRDSFAAPIDMELGPNGQLYVLEYGKAWFPKNPDAGLSRIEYRGRR